MNNEKKEIKQTSLKNMNIFSLESKKILIVNSILQKWSKLQKEIKEGIILKEVILKQQKIDFEQLKEHFIEYYNIKLKTRQTYQEIEMLKDNNKKYKSIFFKKNAEEIFLKSLKPINDLIFILRNNYNYAIKLIELIELDDNTEKSNNINNSYCKDSIIEFFCNQFYDNILIPNCEQEELLILIYKLIEREISKMETPILNQFLSENSFLGKFLNYLMRKSEIKIFLSKLLTPIISSIENESDDLDLSFFSSNNNSNQKNNNSKPNNNQKEEISQNLFEKIPKTKIKFKNNVELDEQIEKESKRKNSLLLDDLIDDSDDINLNKDDSNVNENNEYFELLSEDKIYKKINEAKNDDIKEFYLILLEKIKNHPNLFSNLNLLSIIEGEKIKSKQQENIYKIKNSFLFIQKQIDSLLQSLIDKISAIPYIIKCICKIIYIMVSLKFPSSKKYIINYFIGKFLFDKYIFPSLNFGNINIKENKILSSKTKNILQIIVNVLSKAIECNLFNSDNEATKTIFNYYLIEIIPLLNEFYVKLIDVKFPNSINFLIKNINKDSYGKKKLYNYFKRNSDEILELQCACLSIDDILYILNIINKYETNFKNLKDSELFYNSVHLIDKDIIQEISKNELDTSIFFVLFNEKYKSKINKFLNKDDFAIKNKKINKNEEELKNRRIKLCIKNLLKGLNSISDKSYTYLNNAISNDKFFSLLKYTLEDTEELKNDNEIPLKWYAQYINNNKKELSLSYIKNDYEKLYNEINNEELSNLNKINKISEIIIARDGMNLRCCEKIIEKAKIYLHNIEKTKKYVKIEKFLENEIIEVCIRIKNKNIFKEIEAKKKLEKKKQKKKTSFFSFGKKESEKEQKILIDENPPTIIVTQDFSFCKHKNLEYIEKTKKNNVGCLIFSKRKLIPSHSYYIKDFIDKFSDKPWGDDNINQDIKPKDIIIEEISKGERKNQIYKTFENYMNIIKNKIKSPSGINKNVFKNISEKECNNTLEIIENFIYNKIYKNILPQFLEEDKIFYEKTKCLDWVTPKHLEIDKYHIEQLGMAELCINKFDTAKSLFDKLGYIKDAFTSINNNIKYSEGKNEEAGQDEIIPIFQFILIKAQPKKMRTNINYINCFLSEEKLNGQFGYFESQIESSFNFIMNLNHKNLNIDKEIFDTNYEYAKKRHNVK